MIMMNFIGSDLKKHNAITAHYKTNQIMFNESNGKIKTQVIIYIKLGTCCGYQ